MTAAGTVNLSAASDNVGVTKVEFYRGSILLSTDTTSPYTAADSVTSAQNGTQTYVAKAFDAAGNTRSASASVTVNIAGATPAPTGLKYSAAPYVMPGESLLDLKQVMAVTGQKTFMLAFILAPNGGGCTPTWDGTHAADQHRYAGAAGHQHHSGQWGRRVAVHRRLRRHQTGAGVRRRGLHRRRVPAGDRQVRRSRPWTLIWKNPSTRT
ncbi:Ig-like domain-containing protein [Deinococcus hopiensis]|uniref:Ig-like domain-containing protein n=1 Tax=Deinococcus hopiensis TaxID=309885 RepID=UPI001FEB90E5|nr:Ig-like domain-containing protein [Deinococcus hopiensis]